MSRVTFRVSPVACHVSLTPTATATATDPPPANSLFHKEKFNQQKSKKHLEVSHY